MRQAGYIIGGDYSGGGSGGGSGSGSGRGVNCQDCGNQAKKDCKHVRCRTCCKSRGLPCTTHVRSTWIPAAKRRERHQQLALSSQQQNFGNQQLSLMMRSGGATDQNPKGLREDHQRHHQNIFGYGGGDGVTMPITHHHNTSSGFHFPAEMSSPALFQCVRVSGMDEVKEQLAYQTAVNVGGHVFKGILYDHGPEDRYNHPIGESSSSGAGAGAGAQHQNLNLITSPTTGPTTATTTTAINPAVTFIDPSSMYPTPLCAFMASTQLFPPPRP